MSTARQLKLDWALEFTKSFPLIDRACYFTDNEFKKWHFAIGQRILCDQIWKNRTRVADRSKDEVPYINHAVDSINRAFASPLWPLEEIPYMIFKTPYVPKLGAFHRERGLFLTWSRTEAKTESLGFKAQKDRHLAYDTSNCGVQDRRLLEELDQNERELIKVRKATGN